MDGWLYSLGFLLLTLVVYFIIHIACIKQRCKHARSVYDTLCDYWDCHGIDDSSVKKANLFSFLDGIHHRIQSNDANVHNATGFVRFVDFLKKKYFPEWSKDIEDYISRLR